MQPPPRPPALGPRTPFQYPTSGRTSCNSDRTFERLVAFCGLSIPYDGSYQLQRRSPGLDAPLIHQLSIPYDGSYQLQLPLYVRGLGPPDRPLSIPYDGSYQLQPGRCVSALPDDRPFNTLRRVVPVATPPRPMAPSRRSPFNTLRRVVPVATTFGRDGYASGHTFNTLRRVVPVATRRTNDRPTDGRTTFQYPTTGRTSCNVATLDRLLPRTAAFQYPTTGRTSCNASSPARPCSALSPFQYPTTGRTSCNALPRLGCSTSCWPFNTLRRVVPVATWSVIPCSTPGARTFNTLRRVVPVATRHPPVRARADLRLSIPYDGSYQLQLPATCSTSCSWTPFNTLRRVVPVATTPVNRALRVCRNTFNTLRRVVPVATANDVKRDCVRYGL